MAVKSGRFGEVKLGVDDLTATTVASLNAWKLSLKTDQIDVTVFNANNKMYVPGMRDISGSLGGFWDAAELSIIDATDDDVPSHLVLMPNRNEAPEFSGPAYIDADIDTDVNGAPKLTSTFMAAGDWTLPTSGGAMRASRRRAPGSDAPTLDVDAR